MKKVYGIVLVIVLLFTLSECSTTSTQEEEQYTEATLGNDKVTIDPVAMETDLLALVNQHRSDIGLNALENSTVSYKYAEEHNDYMISKNSLNLFSKMS